MRFEIEFYVSATGSVPVRDFLTELEDSDPNDHSIVVAGIKKLSDHRYHREPLSKPIGQGLFELRHVGKLNTRVLYFFQKGRRIILVHGIRNESQKIPSQAKTTALERMKDWLERNG